MKINTLTQESQERPMIQELPYSMIPSELKSTQDGTKLQGSVKEFEKKIEGISEKGNEIEPHKNLLGENQ